VADEESGAEGMEGGTVLGGRTCHHTTAECGAVLPDGDEVNDPDRDTKITLDPEAGFRVADIGKPTGECRIFETGATRDTDDGKIDYEGFLSPTALERFGEYMHRHRVKADGSLRASDNWTRGIPTEQYVKSLLRHTIELWKWHRTGRLTPKKPNDPQNIEEVLCAILFNAFGILHELLKKRQT
jgi:hypothetical protein